MDPPLVWFLVNITLAGVVFAVFTFFQRRRFLRDKQTMAAQVVHCLESIKSISARINKYTNQMINEFGANKWQMN